MSEEKKFYKDEKEYWEAVRKKEEEYEKNL